jgi:long-chain fatty acid transport protein
MINTIDKRPKIRSRVLALWPIVLLFGLQIHVCGADEFTVFNQGARAAGMANAFVARASDPSAVWYNPAALARLEGFQIYAGGELSRTGPRSYFSVYRNATLAADHLDRILANVYLSGKLSDRIGFGLSVNSPFHYEIEWPQTREFEHLAYFAKRLEIRTLALSSAVAFQLNDHFALGAGVSLIAASFAARYHYPYDIDVMVAMFTNGAVMDAREAIFDLRAFKDLKAGFFAGAQWSVNPSLSFGLVYRSGIPLSFDSGSVFGLEPETPSAYANAKLAEMFIDSPAQSAVIRLSLVDQLEAGAAWRIGNVFETEIDVGVIFWSGLKSLDVDYAVNTEFRSFWTVYRDLEADTYFKNALSLKWGGELHVTPFLDARLGAFLHGSPVTPSHLGPVFPFAKSAGFSLGAGLRISRFQIDAAYVFTSRAGLTDTNDWFLRWGDNAQTYPGRIDQALVVTTGIRL